MSDFTMVRDLVFHVSASVETNDHEVRILADGKDLIGDAPGLMGLDPWELYRQSELLEGGRAIIARCGCGVSGCDSLRVDIRIGAQFAEWIGKNIQLRFAADQYTAWISGAANDHSWEDAGRRAERLVHEHLAGTTLGDGKTLRWASSRIKAKQIQLSFVDDTGQTLLGLDWDGADPATAINAANKLLKQLRGTP